MHNEILRIEHLSKRKSLQNILRSVSFRILSGKKTALLANPFEMQCLIDILFRGDSPDTGKIFVNEILCGKHISENLESEGVYYLAAQKGLISSMTVARNFFLSLSELTPGAWIKDAMLIRETAKLLQEYGLQNISPKARIKDLSYYQVLCLELIILAQKQARLIVLDDFFNQIGETGLEDIEKMIELLYKKNISVLLLANRYHSLFATFDTLFVLQNGVMTGILKQGKISQYNYMRSYHQKAPGQSGNKISNSSTLTVKSKDLEISLDRGDIHGVWCLDGDYLMQAGKQKWELISTSGEKGAKVAVSVNDHCSDKIYKDMSLVDNITYLAHDKVSNALGIINKRLQLHMAQYALELIHSEYLLERYKNKLNIKEISPIDQIKVITAKWLCVAPQVLMYINPFVILDESTLQEFRDLLRALAELKISVIIMSVNHAWLEMTCDYVTSI